MKKIIIFSLLNVLKLCNFLPKFTFWLRQEPQERGFCACVRVSVILFKITVKMSSSSILKSPGGFQGKQESRQASRQTIRQASRQASKQASRQTEYKYAGKLIFNNIVISFPNKNCCSIDKIFALYFGRLCLMSRALKVECTYGFLVQCTLGFLVQCTQGFQSGYMQFFAKVHLWNLKLMDFVELQNIMIWRLQRAQGSYSKRQKGFLKVFLGTFKIKFILIGLTLMHFE